MRIISHRGWWLTPDEKNSFTALRRSVEGGYGMETDVRDLAGKLVVSHDPPHAGAMPWKDVLDLFEGHDLPLAVNIKSDGLAPLIKEAFAERNIPWFAFDMSMPQAVQFAAEGLPFYTRHSDVEPEPNLYADAEGVWLDAFYSDWYDLAIIERHLDAHKQVCIVSPELHGRDYRALWDRLAGLPNSVMLCTDLPSDAKRALSP